MAMAAVGAQGLAAASTKAVCAESSLRKGCEVRPSVSALPLGLGPSGVHLNCRGRWPKFTVCASNQDKFDDKTGNEGEKGPVDWDKAWESFPKPKKQSSFSFRSLLNLDMEKYVNRRPTHSRFPLSEEIDPLRKTERAALDAWIDPKFTLAGVGVVVGLFVYMVVIVGPPPV